MAAKDEDTSLSSTTPASGTLPSNSDSTIVRPGLLPDPTEAAHTFDDRYGVPQDVLGVGGMGEVRSVRDNWIGRHVAIKTLKGDLVARTDSRMRFLREVRVQGQLEHPSIVPVYDVGVTGSEEPFFTMRRVRGLTLSKVIQKLAQGDAEIAARFSRRKLLNAFSTICMTVHYAHTRGVVHRDLKPSNVIFGEFGEVYMIDWGIAKVMRTLDDTDDAVDVGDGSTGSGKMMGTLGYMAPETVKGVSVDPRTDVYSLGVILFELLTLRNILREPNPAKAVAIIEKGVDARASKAAPEADIAPELDDICIKATERDMDARFQTAKELSEAVERYLDGDRDLQRRRELAREFRSRAEAILSDPAHKGDDPDQAVASRIAALREILRAVALDPGDEQALAALGKLVLQPPDEMPRAARREREELRRDERAAGAGLGFRGFLSYLAAFPLMAIAGIRSPLLVGAGLLATIAALVVARWLEKKKRVSSTSFYVLLLISGFMVALQSTWLGPFVLTPVAATITTSLFALYARGRERIVVVAAGAAMVLLPFLAELVPGLPRAFGFDAGNLVLFPRALELPPTTTVIGLVYTTLGFALLPSIFLFKLRDALRVAEDRTFLQAWTLTQLFPGAHRASANPEG